MHIGDAAEDQLSLWASQTGINVVEPKRDRRGWDRVFEFPAAEEHEARDLLDRRPPELVCKLQVKATRDGKKRRESIKLDNWERFAKSPLPCFFVVMEYGSGASPKRVFLVHVGTAWIERVLRRLREEAASLGRGNGSGRRERGKALHHTSMSLTWSDEDLLPEPTGEALAEGIRRAVGNPKEYAEQKIRWMNTLGYGERTADVSFSMAADPDSLSRLADFAIGLTDRIPISSFKSNDIRFGIPLPTNSRSDAVLTGMEPTSRQESRVTIVASDGLRSVAISCDTRASMAMFPFLPKEHWKVRCIAPFFSIVIRPLDGKTHCAFSTGDPELEVSLGEFADLAEVVAIVNQSKGAQIEMIFELSLWKEPVTLVSKGSAPELDPGMTEICTAAEHARWVARAFGLGREHRVVPLDLLDQAPQLAFMYALYHPTPLRAQVTCYGDNGPKPSDKAAIIIAPAVGIGNVVLTALVAVSGEWDAKADDDRIRLTVSGRPRVMNQEVVQRDQWAAWKSQHLERKMKAAAEILERRDGIEYVAYTFEEPASDAP